MRLLVVRHAIAMDREEYQRDARKSSGRAGAGEEGGEANDDFRPLTLEGIRKMRKNAKGLRKLVSRPDAVVTSPLTRALQTAEILSAEWDEPENLFCDALRPDTGPTEFVRWYRAQTTLNELESELVAIVGHEPQLSTLVSWLLTGSARSVIELKKGGACLLEFAKGPEKGKGRLLWLATPSQLRSAL